jgi:ribonuclease HII
MTQPNTIVGIDEAGRGPLAGPVHVGVVALNSSFDFAQFPNFTDSKQMTEASREQIYDQILKDDQDKLSYTVRHSGSQVIDKRGINPAIRYAINRGLRNLDVPVDSTKVLLDGGLAAPSKYTQKAITKGDQKEPVISLASVLAKVARDRYMKKIDGQYDFDFAQHKGYGTKEHRKALQTNGPTDIHRNTFTANIVN